MNPTPETVVWLGSDLDRTLIPNGSAPESPEARPLLRRVAAREDLVLVYVTGRHLPLIRRALDRYRLPVPDYAVGDVGTTLYRVDADGERWTPWEEWEAEIGRDWNGAEREELADRLSDIEALRPQEPEKQNRFKLSYYADADLDAASLRRDISDRLAEDGIRTSVIWSIDEETNEGLLDILPERATKLHALRFLAENLDVGADRMVFAGDSGNDLPALTSGLQSVLVANASEAVRREAVEAVAREGAGDRLYLARGGFLGMNGNYAAGVLEGLAHFFPETRDWMR